ncbi:hypothetical protein WJX74_005479 [Apatococcus lobatus]|uniref:CCAAT-binding factor domain-containing protein n=1 Tax=Apatococcus lobatus TaxID=904363 RepID=A0AAW1RPI1_9CHLO
MTSLKKTSLQQVGNELLKQPLQKANNVTILLAAAKPSSSQEEELIAIHQLHLFFLASLECGQLIVSSQAAAEPEEPEAQHAGWLRKQYSTYISQLQQLLRSSPHPSVQMAALGAGMEAVRAGNSCFQFHNRTFESLVEAMLRNSNLAPEVLSRMTSKYLPHADVRFYTLRAIAAIVNGKGGDSSKAQPSRASGAAKGTQAPPIAALLDLLLKIETPLSIGGVTSWCGALEAGQTNAEAQPPAAKKRRLASSQQHASVQEGAKWARAKPQKRAFTDAWLAVLRVPLTLPDLHRALSHLPDSVIPHLTDPLLLSDFLTHSVDSGGLTGMLALHGIFILVTQHGLEYPHFFMRLYALLTPDIFNARHRVRFLTLADIFLSSGLVPAYTAAAFAKRFARLALTAPPAGAITCTGFIHNLLRRHPACQVLLHRPSPGAGPGSSTTNAAAAASQPSAAGHAATASEEADVSQFGRDPYDEGEPDPAKSQALASSLWEAESLRDHYCPQVAASVSLLDRDFSDPKKTAEVNVQQYAAGSFAAIIKQELDIRLKKAPIAFHSQPLTSLFGTALPILGCSSRWTVQAPVAEEKVLRASTYQQVPARDYRELESERLRADGGPAREDPGSHQG